MKIWTLSSCVPGEPEPCIPDVFTSEADALAGFRAKMADEWASAEPADDAGEPVTMPDDPNDAHAFLVKYHGETWGQWELHCHEIAAPAPPAAPSALILDDQEAAIVLAGLRMIQRLGVQPPEEEVATNDGQFEELGDDAIDELCERINFGSGAAADQAAAAADLIGQDDRALGEGWCLIEGAGGLLEIDCDTDSPIFFRDNYRYPDEAEAFVRRKAAEGSAYHIAALARVGQPG